ncbi:hypothetical protein UFOVP296_33 [uncultured Caudovirales phage]|uniref:Uncharacterized protein n=1 Tax=uncultured Caudovirales phage TaxID=2100421 RepID=A0A6J5LSQ3_9CAUD|nr:hypothetical protein UFOVP296_33 [uncultured Caudovirales phage]CAB4169832.1 hypothetical protein UFOVP912_8 [uncultured Caudovirales phage]CAB4199432.1 hypothetical protein UFOVP1334_40 [uncultured Caudovirales phage]
MKHESEFFPRERKPRVDQEAMQIAGAYARVLDTPDGKAMWADLLRKFDPLRSRFNGHSDAIQAARIDGQSDVMREMRFAADTFSP